VRDAEHRTWEVVKRAYEERTPATSTHRPGERLALVAVVVLGAVVAAVLSPPGRAVFHSVREAVGIQQAAPALFSLPAHGRLLVVSAGNGGVWLVHDNGLKRRLGSYTDAEWSPHGRFVVVTTRSELIALAVDQGVRWSLARRGASSPRWEGTRVDTRIAYLVPGGLRVVAGDGTGDHLLARNVHGVPAAWDPARVHTIAYFAGGAVVLREADTGLLVWRTTIPVTPSALEWSTDGHSSGVGLVDIDRPGRARLLFAGPGVFGDIAWAPDGSWLLVAWPTADQWLFLHGSRVRAVANIEQQFPRADDVAPKLELAGRWCCR